MEAQAAPPFRSDHHLLVLRAGLSCAIPVTILTLRLSFHMGEIFAWSPVAVIPGVLILFYMLAGPARPTSWPTVPAL